MRQLRPPLRGLGGLLLLLGVGLGGCLKSPPPMSQAMQRAQAAERLPPGFVDSSSVGEDAVVQAYEVMLQRCQSGGALTAQELRKDDCGTAAFRRAQRLEQRQQFSEAVQAYQAVPSLGREPRLKARALLRAALLQAEQLGAPKDAAAQCLQLIAAYPTEVASEDALQLWWRLRKQSPDAPGEPSADVALVQLATQHAAAEALASHALLLAGQWADQQGRVEDALRHYDRLVAQYPRGPLLDDGLMAAAQLLRRLSRSAQAVARLEQLVATYRSAMIVGHYNRLLLGDGTLLLGEVYLRDLHQPEQALTTLRKLLVRQPTSRLCDDALVLMAEAVQQRRPNLSPADRVEACGYVERVLRDFPDSNRRRQATQLRAQLRCPGAPVS